MKKLLLLAVAGAVVIGIANSASSPTPNGPAVRPGSAAVYQRIAVETDCVTLQAEFDQAAANGKADRARGALALAKITTTYMSAAGDRMRAIGCY
jgi:hypothetical protein